MILYEVTKELWDIKQDKNTRRNSNDRKKYTEIRTATKRCKYPISVLKTMSKLFGLPTTFFQRIYEYERIEEQCPQEKNGLTKEKKA